MSFAFPRRVRLSKCAKNFTLPLSEGRYLVAVALHNHAEGVEEAIGRYEARLAEAGLPDVPFHGKDMLHGNEGYAAVSPGRRFCPRRMPRMIRRRPCDSRSWPRGARGARGARRICATSWADGPRLFLSRFSHQPSGPYLNSYEEHELLIR